MPRTDLRAMLAPRLVPPAGIQETDRSHAAAYVAWMLDGSGRDGRVAQRALAVSPCCAQALRYS